VLYRDQRKSSCNKERDSTQTRRKLPAIGRDTIQARRKVPGTVGDGIQITDKKFLQQ
jgi:hypothetical protein